MTRSKRKVFWLPNIYMRSCLHFPFLFLTSEVAHRHGHPPTHTRGCVPRYTCLTHAGSMCMGAHPHTPRTAVPLGLIYFPSQAWVFVLRTKESTFGFLQKNPEIRIQVQGIYWGGVIWKIPLWKWSSEAETVRNVVNPQWWLWSTGTQLPWGVLGETVEPENYLWIISPQRGGRWNLYPHRLPFCMVMANGEGEMPASILACPTCRCRTQPGQETCPSIIQKKAPMSAIFFLIQSLEEFLPSLWASVSLICNMASHKIGVGILALTTFCVASQKRWFFLSHLNSWSLSNLGLSEWLKA